MSTVCTSCGIEISPFVSFYKCRQCVNHYVCQLCKQKDHNRASAAFHVLDKVCESKIDQKSQELTINVK